MGTSAPSGFSIAVAEAYASDSDRTIEWIRFRWPELAADLSAGGFDLALSGITVRPDRSVQGRFSLPLTLSGATVLVLADSPIRSAAELDRGSVVLAVNAGGHLERVARRLFPSARIEAIPDNAAVLPTLLRDGPNRVDAVVTDSLEAPVWQRATDRRLRAIGPLTRDRKAAWFPPDREAEVRRFDRWLLRAEREGRLASLRQGYGLPDDATARPLPALLASLDERLGLMPEVADAKRVLGVPVENRAREEVVLAAATRAVERAAADAGSIAPDRDAVRRFFRAQIEAAKWIQTERLHTAPPADPSVSASERQAARARLDDEIRPALIFLGDRIAMLVVESSNRPSRQLELSEVAIALARHGLPEPILRDVQTALADTLRREAAVSPGRPPRPEGTDRATSASTRTARP